MRAEREEREELSICGEGRDAEMEFVGEKDCLKREIRSARMEAERVWLQYNKGRRPY